jgi:hypothetical protein
MLIDIRKKNEIHIVYTKLISLHVVHKRRRQQIID